MKIVIIGECPVCLPFLEDHPTLDVKNVRRIKFKRAGGYYHTSKYGRMLHKYVVKKNARSE